MKVGQALRAMSDRALPSWTPFAQSRKRLPGAAPLLDSEGRLGAQS